MNRKSATRYLPLTLALAAATTAGAAEGPRVLEEVHVTAQKRSESLQDVPISIAVVSAEDISALNIQDFSETDKLTPGVDLFPGLQAAAIRLRGVGPAFFAVGTPQSVAVFVDEVAQSQVGAVFSTLVDVERIELLRGPQGTLYGENAPGGVYNITTRRPDAGGWSGYIEGSYSQFDDSDLATTDLRGAVNIPLIEDRLALRIAGVYADADGYVTIENPLSADDATGGKEHKAVRSRLLMNMTDDMELLWTVNYQDLIDYRAEFNPDGLVPGTGGTNATPAIFNEFEDRRYYGDFRSEVTGDLRDTALHWTWDADLTQVDVIGYYQEFDTESNENRAPYPEFVNNFNIGLDYEISTLELRFTGTGELFDYVSGLYYSDRQSDNTLDLLIEDALVVGGGKAGSETYSAYANVTWHINEQWDFSGGLRYDDNEVTTDAAINLAGAFDTALDDTLTSDHLSWSAKLRHFLTEDTTIYIAADNAYKQGGFNTLLNAAVDLEGVFPDAGRIANEQLVFDEETSTAFEVGVKGVALDQTLQYSVAVFYQEFDDHQIAHFAPAGSLEPLTALFANVITNAEEVTTQGIEFDVTWLVSEHWAYSNRTAYFEAEAKEWSNHFCSDAQFLATGDIVCPLEDADLNELPQWNMNNQLAYNRLLDNGWEAYSVLSWTWQSEPNYTDNTDQFDSDRHRYDASFGLRSADLGLDVRVWGKNLTDEDLNINPGIKENGDPALPSAFEGRYYRGLEYGLTLRYDFQ